MKTFIDLENAMGIMPERIKFSHSEPINSEPINPKGHPMKSPFSRSKAQKINSEIQQHYIKTGEPVSLNELPLWKLLNKSKRIRTGRGFKKMVVAGEIEGIKFVGVRKDNHSTYIPTGSSGGGVFGLFKRIFT